MNTNAIAYPTDRLGFCHRYGFQPKAHFEGQESPHFSPASYHALCHFYHQFNAVAWCHSVGGDFSTAVSEMSTVLGSFPYPDAAQSVAAPGDLALPNIPAELVAKLLDRSGDLAAAMKELGDFCYGYHYGPDQAAQEATIKARKEAQEASEAAEDKAMASFAAERETALGQPCLSVDCVTGVCLDEETDADDETTQGGKNLPDTFDYQGDFRLNFLPEAVPTEGECWDYLATGSPEETLALYLDYALSQLQGYLNCTRLVLPQIIAPLFATMDVKDFSHYGELFPETEPLSYDPKAAVLAYDFASKQETSLSL